VTPHAAVRQARVHASDLRAAARSTDPPPIWVEDSAIPDDPAEVLRAHRYDLITQIKAETAWVAAVGAFLIWASK
jgi:hypothetical protein